MISKTEACDAIEPPRRETLNEARVRLLLHVAVGVAAYLECTPTTNVDEVMACAKQLVHAMRVAARPAQREG